MVYLSSRQGLADLGKSNYFKLYFKKFYNINVYNVSLK